MDVVEYLESKNVELKPGGHGNVKTHCFYCDEEPNKQGRLYINVDPESDRYGRFICFRAGCGKRGGINTLRHHFGDPPLDEVYQSEKGLRILDSATDYYAERLLDNDEVFDYLTYQRGLDLKTIMDARLGWSDGGLLKHLLAKGFTTEEVQATGLINQFGKDYFRERITLPYLEYGITTSIRGKEIGAKYLGMPGIPAKLYGIDSVRDSETVMLAAGEFDQLILTQMGYKAVGVPGERIWKDDWNKELEHVKRFYIMFDSDTAGQGASEKLATTLGPKARVVNLPQANPGKKKIDVSEWAVNYNKTKEDFDFLISKAKGGLLVSPGQAYERWLEIEGNPNLVGLKFNISNLDNELTHGLTPGQVVTLLARTNVGKSLFTFNVLHRMRILKPELKVLLLSLEQTRNEWFERAHRINCFYNPASTVSDTISFWQDNLYLVDKNRVSEEVLAVCLDQFNFDMGQYPDIVVVDYLGYYARSYPGEEYQRISSAMMAVKALAKEYQSVFFVPHQANRSNDLGGEVRLDEGQGSGLVEQTSDLVLSLWNPDQKPSGTPEFSKSDQKKELILKVQKSRDGGVGVQFKMQSAPLTLAIVPRSDPLYDRALKEREFWIGGCDWKEAVYRHKTGDLSL